MLRLHRSERVTRLAHADTSVALTESIWSVSVGGEHRAGRFSYRAPSSVVVDGLPPVRIHDYVMIARVGALAATAAMVLGGITQRETHIKATLTNRKKLS